MTRHASTTRHTRGYRPIVALAAVLSLWCEGTDPLQAPPLIDPAMTGMRLVRADGMHVDLGSRDFQAKVDELPPMRVEFTYDFWMDRTEVTQREYYELLGTLPREYGGHPTGDLLPVAFVSWFDAIRYCNQRSVAAGLDTVYSYAGVDSTIDGTVRGLSGLQVHLQRHGYRLPTEAEFEYAAQAGVRGPWPWGYDAGQAPLYAWFVDNADVHTHEVGGLRPNRFDLYDMAGNVMEWVGDYLGALSDTTVTDYAGPPYSPDDLRPVKGGSYLHPVDQLRSSSRSDTYDSYSSTAAGYIGFRCVLGRIGAPTYLVAASAGADTVPVSLAATTKWVTPTSNTRLVYVRRAGESRTLCAVDFFDVLPQETEYQDMTSVYLPTISPDGNWVAFCTGGEGLWDGSSVYIRRLDSTGTGLVQLADQPAFAPRWWVDPASSDTFLVYTSSTVLNSAPSWSTTSTSRQRVSGGTPLGDPEVIESQGSYHGGLSPDGTRLATGFPLLYVKDLAAGTRQTLFTAPRNGKAVPDTSQVCNVSMSPPGLNPPQLLFIDFGSYGQTSAVTGDAYGVHDYLFRMSLDGRVTGAWHCPYWVESWDHPEWSNHPDVAVVGVQDSRGRRPAIYAINLQTGGAHTIASSNSVDLWHPYFWVDPRPAIDALPFDLDSLGYYAFPRTSNAQSAQASKMSRFWRLHSGTEILCMGSSRMEGGIAAAQMTAGQALNLGAAGVELRTIDGFLREYALVHCDQLKLVCISLQPGWMADTVRTGDWTAGIGNSTGFHYDRNHGMWADGLPGQFTQYVSNAPGAQDDLPDTDRGWTRHEPLGWRSAMFAGSGDWTTADSLYQESLSLLANMAALLASRDIHLLAVAFPQAPIYRQFALDSTRYYGRYGPTLQTAEAIWQDLADLASVNPYFHFYDAHQFGLHDYVNEDSYDADHLSWIGAEKLTARVDGLVGRVISDQ